MCRRRPLSWRSDWSNKQLCRFANGETPELFIHPALRAIIVHFRLADDHPFCDGNGRTARALFHWAMLHQGYSLFALISISSVINKARGQYERSFLFSESDEHDFTTFPLAQVKVIQAAIANLHAYLERKAGEINALQRRLEGVAGLNHRQLALLRHALGHSWPSCATPLAMLAFATPCFPISAAMG